MDAQTGKASVSSDRPAIPSQGLTVGPLSPCAAFQQVVEDYLIRHRSIIDVLSKCQESTARVNRAVAKAVTTCGCVRIQADAQQYPADADLREMRRHMSTHLDGQLCDHCRDMVDAELGRALFYLTALCNLLDLQLEEVITGETKRITALGIFNLT